MELITGRGEEGLEEAEWTRSDGTVEPMVDALRMKTPVGLGLEVAVDNALRPEARLAEGEVGGGLGVVALFGGLERIPEG